MNDRADEYRHESYYLRREQATFRLHSMNRSASGDKVRFFTVMNQTGAGGDGTLIGKP